jgi:hypothetical protein
MPVESIATQSDRIFVGIGSPKKVHPIDRRRNGFFVTTVASGDCGSTGFDRLAG